MDDPRDDVGGAHAGYRTRTEWVEHRAGAQRRLTHRALRLTALSALLPGAGLIRTRLRWVGLVLVAIALTSAAALLYYVSRNGLTRSALATAASPGRLKLILGVLLAGTVVWIGAIALTALLTRPRRQTTGQRTALALFTGLLCLAVSAPAALGTQYITSHLKAMDKVFSGQHQAPGAPEPTSSLSKDPKNPWADLPHVNILLLGSDAGQNREGTRTDTMIVASIDTKTGESVLFSIPRNLQQVPIPRENPLHKKYPGGRFDCGNQCLMNAIWTEAESYAEEHPELYAADPTPGLTATREVLQAVLGIPIHHNVIVNLEGFEELIDAMGGVTINVKERIPINGYTYTDAAGTLQLDYNSPRLEWLEPGVQKLDGNQALGYSRSRVTTDDFSRMRRQRCMVAAIIDQAEPITLLQRYPQIITAVGNNVTTDVPQGDLGVWAELVQLVQQSRIRSLPFTVKNTDVGDPDYAEIRYKVWEALNGTPAPKPKPKPDSASATTSPATTDGPTTEAPDDGQTTTEESDELSDIGAVCD